MVDRMVFTGPKTWRLLGGLALFAVQLVIALRTPSLGLYSPFPFSTLRSFTMPIVVGATAAASFLMTTDHHQKRILGSILIAALCEILIVELMLKSEEPLFMIVVFALNSFMAVQFISYSADAVRSDER